MLIKGIFKIFPFKNSLISLQCCYERPTLKRNLAVAFQEVLSDTVFKAVDKSVTQAVKPLRDDITILGTRMDNMESNLQEQLSQHRKDVASDVREAVEASENKLSMRIDKLASSR